MNTTRLRQARRLFMHEHVPRSTARHNMRTWVRSVRRLGSAWILANPANRFSASDRNGLSFVIGEA